MGSVIVKFTLVIVMDPLLRIVAIRVTSRSAVTVRCVAVISSVTSPGPWKPAGCGGGAARSGRTMPAARSRVKPATRSNPLIVSRVIIILPCARDVLLSSVPTAAGSPRQRDHCAPCCPRLSAEMVIHRATSRHANSLPLCPKHANR